MRVTSLLRAAIGTGFAALFPAFAYLGAAREFAAVKVTLRLSVVAQLFLGTVLLGGFISLAEPAYGLWLGNPPAGLLGATVVLALWHVVTLGGSPCWYLLLATDREDYAARAVWFQMGIVLIVWVSGAFAEITLNEILLVWLASSVGVQVILFAAVQREFSVLSSVKGDPWFWLTLAGSWTLLLTIAAASLFSKQPPVARGLASIACLMFYSVLLARSLWLQRRDLVNALVYLR